MLVSTFTVEFKMAQGIEVYQISSLRLFLQSIELKGSVNLDKTAK